MCAITGIINNNRNSKQIINKMLLDMVHRGPDESGVFEDQNVS